ncbi:MAG: hypothetical protein U5O39_13745 [Gammaproteobacteria bacterium]|nr:hypothetical protein [Gammaproteobacteria bacterium]
MNTAPELDPLARQYAIEHAAEVARFANEEATEDIVAFISKLPPATSCAVLSRLATRQLSAVLASLDPATIGRLLTESDHDDMVTVLAHLPTSRYEQVLEASSTTASQNFAIASSFLPRTSARLPQRISFALSMDALCGDVKRELETSENDNDRPIIVVDETGRYQGLISPFVIVKDKHAHLPIGARVQSVEPLRASMPVRSALSAPGWREFSALAVVDRQELIVGAISEAQLWRAMGKAEPVSENLEQLVSEVASGYLAVCAELIESIVGNRRS